MPAKEVRTSIIDTWASAFPSTPKVMLIGDEAGMAYATGVHRTGWRADCWGDMNWHMPYFYDPQLQRTNATEAWRNGPIALEPCWEMSYWREKGWNISYILDWALNHHASYVQNKSQLIPPDWLPEVQRALRRIGYRLVLRELKHPQLVAPGSSFQITMTWENVGVAPPYWDYHLHGRLKHRDTVWISPALLSIKGWQPGTKVESVKISLPSNLPPGEYELALGIFSPYPEHTHPNLKFVKLAIQTPPDENGWYSLSRFTLLPISSVEEHEPFVFLFRHNYPNPFNQTSTIRFSLLKREYVMLKVFDIVGREVATLVEGALNAGEHHVLFDAAGLPSGVYFYQLKTPSFSETRKATVMK
ncbi:MAG: DUF4832 domain-containing protein [candidate division KSB1 bacterium]|nr:DUF4832 domain-containing protein [candidate division KSB1 bacterium]MDZ7368269.1 DUF4832 domain-containing protein [candidate division KSB1 bacterium]MDZ7406151.1 DUF4832 domain-containing protein [candidate division KSB1 bacterium]